MRQLPNQWSMTLWLAFGLGACCIGEGDVVGRMRVRWWKRDDTPIDDDGTRRRSEKALQEEWRRRKRSRRLEIQLVDLPNPRTQEVDVTKSHVLACTKRTQHSRGRHAGKRKATRTHDTKACLVGRATRRLQFRLEAKGKGRAEDASPSCSFLSSRILAPFFIPCCSIAPCFSAW